MGGAGRACDAEKGASQADSAHHRAASGNRSGALQQHARQRSQPVCHTLPPTHLLGAGHAKAHAHGLVSDLQ